VKIKLVFFIPEIIVVSPDLLELLENVKGVQLFGSQCRWSIIW